MPGPTSPQPASTHTSHPPWPPSLGPLCYLGVTLAARRTQVCQHSSVLLAQRVQLGLQGRDLQGGQVQGNSKPSVKKHPEGLGVMMQPVVSSDERQVSNK